MLRERLFLFGRSGARLERLGKDGRLVGGAGRDSKLDEDVEESWNCGCSLLDEQSISCGYCSCGGKRDGPQERGRKRGKSHVRGERKAGLRTPATGPPATGKCADGIKATLWEHNVEGSVDLATSWKWRKPARFVEGDDILALVGTLVEGLEYPIARIGAL
jgi:hypothetical protein